jgi:two-component system, OmpR family, sensor histidine kinase ChvG
VLNRTPESFKTDVELEEPDDSEAPPAKGRRRFVDLLHRGWHLFVRITFSSLTRRIVFLNVTGLLALVIGILYLSVPA